VSADTPPLQRQPAAATWWRVWAVRSAIAGVAPSLALQWYAATKARI
jgi:hypothetical protein